MVKKARLLPSHCRVAFFFPALAIVAVLSFPYAPLAQDERLIPSYDERSGFIRDYPDIDLDVSPYVSSWKDSPERIGHGGFVERDIFTRGDPLHPAKKGAVLVYLKQYTHCVLGGNALTESSLLRGEQDVFYITRGMGRIESGAERVDIAEGAGVFVPAGVECRFVNTSGVPLEAILVAEELPAGFTPAGKIVVKRYRDQTPSFCCWAYTVFSLFGKDDGLAEPMGIAVVAVEGFGMGSPHFHVRGCEEIWLKLSGAPNPLLLGKKLLRQDIGDAFLPAPNGLMPHAVVNDTDSPMTWLYVGNRRDHEKGK
jgi:hypothetical protein